MSPYTQYCCHFYHYCFYSVIWEPLFFFSSYIFLDFCWLFELLRKNISTEMMFCGPCCIISMGIYRVLRTRMLTTCMCCYHFKYFSVFLVHSYSFFFFEISSLLLLAFISCSDRYIQIIYKVLFIFALFFLFFCILSIHFNDVWKV